MGRSKGAPRDVGHPETQVSMLAWPVGIRGEMDYGESRGRGSARGSRDLPAPRTEDGQAGMNFKLGRGRGESSLVLEPSTQAWDAHLHHNVREGGSACLLGP